MNALPVALFAGGLLACSGRVSPDAPATSDSDIADSRSPESDGAPEAEQHDIGPDTRTDADGLDVHDDEAGSAIVRCGTPPYILLTGGAYPSDGGGGDPSSPIHLRKVVWSLCPSTPIEPGGDGRYSVFITPSAPVFATFSADGYPDMVGTETVHAADGDWSEPMLPAAFLAAAPGYSATAGTIWARVLDGGCDQTGVTIAVDGHPDAVITYYGADNRPSTTLKSTSFGGVVMITGLPPDATLDLVVSKDGCVAKAFGTGKIATRVSSVSRAVFYMNPL